MSRFAKWGVGVLSLAGVIATSSLAMAEEPRDAIQRRDLALIQSQLEQITHVIDRLEARQDRQASPSMSLYLDIPRLRQDVEAIAEGIDGYLAPPRLPARQVPPLDGDYVGVTP
ncbi:integrative conjugative element protein, RAQPRD family [Chromohalobacter japonicus]|uniref:integrative conjugative element protein, RAQPRD family n=1 Tax=Chromohalobacter japonicus TaxID=223900 RepID=UPI001FF4BE86|nr:RAQPRD family integrative conjugative element protein [Chromohalobacter japonicus]MCK0753570.1 RAQPRD family integrative conjugative element protein [Chromohalobacter japonicus]